MFHGKTMVTMVWVTPVHTFLVIPRLSFYFMIFEVYQNVIVDIKVSSSKFVNINLF